MPRTRRRFARRAFLPWPGQMRSGVRGLNCAAPAVTKIGGRPPRQPRLHGLRCGLLLLATTAVVVPVSGAAAAPAARSLPISSALVPVQADSADIRAANVTGLPGQPIPLKIEVTGTGAAGKLILLHGVPEGTKLNVGGFFGSFWAVNSRVIDQLTLTPPANFSGSFTVSVVRSGVNPQTARPASFTVTVGEPQATQTAAPPRLAPAPAAPAARKPIANEAMLMGRASDLFKKGDVSAARVIYEFLASQGSAAAAFAMGETYDPAVLRQVVIKGLEASPERAEHWYEIAHNLGSNGARDRINALATR